MVAIMIIIKYISHNHSKSPVATPGKVIHIRKMVISPVPPIIFKESLDGLFKEAAYR